MTSERARRLVGFVSSSIIPHPQAAAISRYDALQTLGQGSTGTVYLARDRETGGIIALKKLLRLDPRSVLRLKREFRSLADVNHPNLVRLYDLAADGDGWFITMEYVEGADLLTHLGGSPFSSSDRDVASTRELAHPARSDLPPPNLDPVLAAFQQLALGIHALHQAGMLHRDLKPSNVLVARDRVVVLDFGLVRELEEDDSSLTQDGSIAGTPAYMAPEQAAGKRLDEAADWYAFGAMLYQALSGELPIEGRTPLQLIQRKTTTDPIPIERLVRGLPSDVIQLCNGLLQRDPKRRPSGGEVLATLEQLLGRDGGEVSRTGEVALATHTEVRSSASALVGRRAELLQLMASFDDARSGGAVVAHVRGTSGAGKSTLVEHFLRGLKDDSPRGARFAPLVFRSRCNEREAMPYKALDGVMDALVQHLLALDDFNLGHLLPADIGELAQLFPVLQRVPRARALIETTKVCSDSLQARVRGEAALRELFSRLALRRPLVLWFDDLQWGDLDSAKILREWPEQLGGSPVLLVFSYRREEVATSPCLRELLAQAPSSLRIVELNELDGGDVRALCEARLGPLAAERPELIERIAAESQGSPYLVTQLAALLQAKLARGDGALERLSVEQLATQAAELLPPEAVRVLNVLAIAGRPMPPGITLRAANVHRDGRELLHALRSLRLLRVRDTGSSHLLEVYHDRVREGVVATLEPGLRAAVHAELLAVLEGGGDNDASFLFSLAIGALQPAAALRYGLAAAERAEAALAFERAAELIEQCLELASSVDPAQVVALQRRLAECLARAGHGARAAEAYLAAAKGVGPDEAVSCMRLAASHLMRCGEFERGDRIVRDVLGKLGVHLPATEAGMLAAIGWDRALIALRGLDFVPANTPTDPKTHATVALYARLTIEYQAYDPVRAALFQSRALRAALGSRDAYAVARSLCVTAIVTCMSGSPRAARETDALLARAEALAASLGRESVRADVLASRAIASYMLGRLHDIVEPAYEAERLYRADPGGEVEGDYFHRFVVVAVRIGTLFTLGRNEQAQLELARSLEEAKATNNHNAILQLSICQTMADALGDRLEKSKARLNRERELLPPDGFGPLHALHMIAVMRTACGTHDYAWADAWLEDAWAKWKRSWVRLSAFMTVLALAARLRYLVNRHVVGRRSEDLQALLRDDLKAAARMPLADTRTALIARTKARLEYLKGRRQAAVALLEQSVVQLEQYGATADAARERYALAYMIGGSRGATMAAECERKLRESGVVDPRSELWAYYPELKARTSGGLTG